RAVALDATSFPSTTLFRSVVPSPYNCPNPPARVGLPAPLAVPAPPAGEPPSAGAAEPAGEALPDGEPESAGEPAVVEVAGWTARSEEHTSELQSPYDPVCR